MPYREAVGRLIFMSWNPGGGARKLAQVIDTGGYHVVAVQEVREDFLGELDTDRWSYCIAAQQFIGARKPIEVETIACQESERKIRWHFATLHFEQQHVGKDNLGVMSVHLNNVQAKKPCAGPEELGKAIDKTCNADRARWVDLICGDINMARWKRATSTPNHS